ncbi:MAG: large conductance mechanosensitive channel protein MscL [Phycisphaeraceae bacterium]|nr:large conductance mechanosensitive channel protein MscL [Phycisphaeraceae bacterium]MCW5768181.1 large conductance mechanosensitive channel protein MscL [Phycisphaeraceae bacterium]
MGIVKEFRDFALKGNVLDLAVAVIIGGAFGKIINSMIADVIMPVVSIPGKADFSNLYFPLNAKVSSAVEAAETAGTPLSLAAAREHGPVFAYGSFLTETLNFIILAFCVFIMIKIFNTARKRFEAEKPAAAPAGPTVDQQLLTEIRDLLSKRG